MPAALVARSPRLPIPAVTISVLRPSPPVSVFFPSLSRCCSGRPSGGRALGGAVWRPIRRRRSRSGGTVGRIAARVRRSVDSRAVAVRRIRAAGHREARRAEARTPDRPQPRDRGSGRDPGPAGDQGAHRQADQGRDRNANAAFITTRRAAALRSAGIAEAPHRPVPSAGSADTGRGGPVGRGVLLRAGTDTGRDGSADVGKRHRFASEHKGKHADPDAAGDRTRQQSLENPRLRIVSDRVRFRIRTNGTSGVGRTHEVERDDLADAAMRDRLKWAFPVPGRRRREEPVSCSPSAWQPRSRRLGQTLRERGAAQQARPPEVADHDDASPRSAP